MEFVPAANSDFDTIFKLYDQAIEFQKTVFDKQWLGFDADLVNREIAEGRLWKIVDDGNVACIYSLAYEDPIIWGRDSHIAAMYIHRIVTNPEFRGRGYVRAIVDWARHHAAENDLRYIRMDTWADNLKLKDYYIGSGFEWKGTVSPEDSPTMPAHYRGIQLGLFEMDLGELTAVPRAQG
jgi:ribosomal protein S18 acetylase RimI-like enzyme